MMKNIIKKIVFFAIICTFSYGDSLSFKQAWQILLQNSDELKSKQEDVNIALLSKGMAKSLYMPNVSLSALYTHLEKPVTASMDGFGGGLDEQSLALIVGGISSSVAKAAYDEALLNGATDIQAKQKAKEAGLKTKNAFAKGLGKLKNSSIELANQDLYNVSVRAIWPLFTGGKRRGANVIAKAKTKEAKALFELSKQGQFEDLANIYFGLALAKNVTKTKEDVVNSLKEHLKHSRLLFKNGQIAKIEVLSAKARYDKAVVDASKAKRNEEIAKLALKSTLHLKKDFDISTALQVGKTLPSLDEFSTKTLATHPGLEVIRSKKAQTDGLVKVKKADFYPKVFLFGNYNIYKDDSLLFKNSSKWAVGVGASYDILSSKGRSEGLDIARSKRLQVSYAHEETKRKILLLVEKTYRLAKLSLEEYEGLSSSLELAHENIKSRQKLFSQGMGTSLDVIDAQLFLQSIKIQRLVASYKYITSLSKLLALSGEIENFFTYQGSSYER